MYLGSGKRNSSNAWPGVSCPVATKSCMLSGKSKRRIILRT